MTRTLITSAAIIAGYALSVSSVLAPMAGAQTTSPYLQPAIQSGLALPPSLADLVEKISPAVLNIKVTTDDGETTTLGQGSGFIISPQGEVVTNYHVIEGGDIIQVEFNNGDLLPAEIIGEDPETDLALLKIDSNRTFPTVKFHKGKRIRIGDYVVAIGNPFGIGQSTSLGIISAIGRDTVDSGSYVDYIQTDATINTGNSGGPLFNPKGDVVGVNSAIYSPTGASVGIAFAIPHYTAEEVVNAIRRHGEVRRGWLGAGLRTAEFSVEEVDSGVFKAGATVNNLYPGSPAELAGLRIDDIILNINGKSVLNSVEATRIIGRLRPGQKAKLIIERDEVTQTITVVIDERPEKEDVEEMIRIASSADIGAEIAAAPTGGTGLSMVDLSSSFRDSIGMRPDQVGVYVDAVAPGSLAEQKGFRPGMVLLEADHEPIPSVSAFNSMYNKNRETGLSSMTLKVRLENGGESYVSLPYI